MQLQLLKVETQGFQVCWVFTTLRYNQTKFKKVEVSSLEHYNVFWRLSHWEYDPNRTISNFNYIQVLKRRKNTSNVYNRILQVVLIKNVSITCIFIALLALLPLFKGTQFSLTDLLAPFFFHFHIFIKISV